MLFMGIRGTFRPRHSIPTIPDSLLHFDYSEYMMGGSLTDWRNHPSERPFGCISVGGTWRREVADA